MKPNPIALLAIALTCLQTSSAGAADDIRLVLQITIDGFRQDLSERYRENFGKGGLAYLLDKGVVYRNAHYLHANTETIVGHTTLATGAFPADHGMTGNAWYDRATGELSYNIEDPNAPLLPSRDEVTKGAQVDPSQKLARTEGRSPVAILAETISDRMAAYYGQQSKIFGVSGKDRAAVAMAGHAGKAFGFSTNNGDFVTSTYYYDAYPEWASNWNAQRKAEALAGQSWSLLMEQSRYLLGHQDDRPYEVDLRGYGRTFPHLLAEQGNPLLPTQILVSPYGDQLTLDFAQTLIEAEGLGQDEIPDYLSISFSGVDAVNHFFGPSSLENEDMVLHLDRTLAQLISFIKKKVGLEHTLIVLSADHGMAEMPEYMSEQGFPAGRLYPEEIIEVANTAGEEMFGIENVVKFFFRPYLYLEDEKIEASKHSVAEVRRGIAHALTERPNIALAVSGKELRKPQSTSLRKRIKRNHHPQRSGDIYVAQDTYWFNFEKGPIAAMHGSPWNYDTHVPIIFAGAGIDGEEVNRLVHPSDVAPTLAALLGMTAPGSASGTVLPEAVDARD